jgi:hypothetical protein
MVAKYASSAGIPKKITCHGLFFTCSTHSSVPGKIDFYPKTSLRNDRKRSSIKDMLLDSDALRKMMEYTSL